MIPFSSTYSPSSNLANLHSFSSKEHPKPASSALSSKPLLSSPVPNLTGAHSKTGPEIKEEPIEEPQELVPEATIQFYEEDIAEYRPGGYHPVSVGDIFNSKYEIIQKLGFGKFSTIWLAIDTTIERPIALKILKADSHGIETDIHEQEALKYAKSNDPNHKIGLLEQFIHKGPNGDHVCLVFDKLEPKMGAVRTGE